MKVNIQSVNFNIDQSLVEFVTAKVDNLDKFYDKIIDADVFLKVQNTSEKENKRVEVRLNIQGDEFIVKKLCKSFEEGIDLSAVALKRQLKKKKERRRVNQL